MTTQASPGKSIKELRLPMSRVKTIMKSSPQVEAIGQDCLFVVAKATEFFVHYLSEEAYQKIEKNQGLEYKHLAEVVQTNETLEFLREIMPRKITVRQFKQMMAEKNSDSSSDSDSDSQSDSESESDSEEDEDDDKAENGNSSDSESDKANGKHDSSDSGSKSEDSEDDNKI